ncbi:MAG: hypothetical protein PHI31_02980 [Desulfuromonadaceae bacterium]|nr:hypothetical protein [Desulfuromonadaceae bacterium]
MCTALINLTRVARGIRTFLVLFSLLLISGCFGDYQLVSFGSASNISGWHQYVNPRKPVNPTEEIVIKVAQTRKNGEYSDSEIVYIVSDNTKQRPVHIVDVIGKPLNDTAYPERLVSRYRVSDGMIVAMSEPATEFYVDANLERAILRAISKTWSSDRVVIYNNGSESVAIISHAVNNCTADVKLFRDAGGFGTPLVEKRVAFCFVR